MLVLKIPGSRFRTKVVILLLLVVVAVVEVVAAAAAAVVVVVVAAAALLLVVPALAEVLTAEGAPSSNALAIRLRGGY